MSDIKQLLIVRKDLNMRKGKIAAQVAHASLKVILDMMSRGLPMWGDEGDRVDLRMLDLSDRPEVTEWLDGSFTKICVSVDSVQELVDIYNAANEAGLNCSIIEDSGRTEFHGIPTKTVVAIGPNKAEDIDKITGHLKLL